MKIGYARVSTLDQNPDMQRDELQKAGCERVIVDQVSGTVANRPSLAEVKKLLRKEDTLVVWHLDRLGRSLRDLIEWAQWLEENGVGLQSLHESIDTSTPTGKLTFHLFGALQFAGRVEDAPLMEAVVFLQDLLRNGRAPRRVDPATFPTAFIPKTLRRHLFVETEDAPKKKRLQVDLYEFLVYRLVRNALEAGDLYVADSTEFRRFEDDLTGDTRWQDKAEALYIELHLIVLGDCRSCAHERFCFDQGPGSRRAVFSSSVPLVFDRTCLGVSPVTFLNAFRNEISDW